MKQYRNNETLFALIDGDLYVRLEPFTAEDIAPLVYVKESAPPKRGRPAKAERRSGKLGPDAKQAIREEIAGGAKDKELADKYGVSVATISYYRRGSKPSTGVVERVKNYQCMKGHRFQSTLPQQKAICPTCREKVFREVPTAGGILEEMNN